MPISLEGLNNVFMLIPIENGDCIAIRNANDLPLNRLRVQGKARHEHGNYGGESHETNYSRLRAVAE